MKKLVLSSVCTLALAGVAFAQGSVNWTAVPTGITAQTNSTAYSPLMGGGSAVGGAIGATATTAGGFYFELLIGATTTSGNISGIAPTSLAALGTWTDSGLVATNSNGATAGRLVTKAGGSITTVAGLTPGVTNYIMLVGWSANLGTTWTDASTALNTPATLNQLTSPAYFGISTVGFITPNAVGVTGAAVFGTANTVNGLPINSPNTQLYLVPTTPVPEPGTMALAALGGASLLLFRRRK